MRKILLTLIFIGLFSICAYSQTANCEADLQTANARLLKTLDALEKAEGLIKVLNLEIEARKRLETTNGEIIAAKDDVISEQKKLILILEKNSQRKLSILFGLIKVRF